MTVGYFVVRSINVPRDEQRRRLLEDLQRCHGRTLILPDSYTIEFIDTQSDLELQRWAEDGGAQ